MTRRLVAAVVVVAAVALTTGCGDPNPHAEVRLTLDEFSLRLAPRSSDEGTIKIFVDNVGELPHGLVFARARSAEELPLTAEGAVDLTKVQVADQLQPVAPGKYRIAPDLFPGPLVVFCNLVTKGPDGQPVSHFRQGMWATLDVRDVGD